MDHLAVRQIALVRQKNLLNPRAAILTLQHIHYPFERETKTRKEANPNGCFCPAAKSKYLGGPDGHCRLRLDFSCFPRSFPQRSFKGLHTCISAKIRGWYEHTLRLLFFILFSGH
uniref:(northern house mosquito) hypothetical protein n=1 Tax=Culex pipiens TaxID=7175 RepID=A0A8D8A1E5_CULPI